MPNAIERALEAALAGGSCVIGEVAIHCPANGFTLSHRDDRERKDLQVFDDVAQAAEIARFDDAGNYRPLKTAPNLRHGWRLEVVTLAQIIRALDYFYPGRLAALAGWKERNLKTTVLRETLDRQSGMYRIASKISDDQINEVVANFCRSDGGCLRTILWKRDATGAVASTKLPPEKFDPECDQAQASRGQGAPGATTALPLLCQEACNLLVAECRKVVKMEGAASSGPE